jgi:hypothetical protein
MSNTIRIARPNQNANRIVAAVAPPWTCTITSGRSTKQACSSAQPAHQQHAHQGRMKPTSARYGSVADRRAALYCASGLVLWRFPDAGRVGGGMFVTAGVWKPSHNRTFKTDWRRWGNRLAAACPGIGSRDTSISESCGPFWVLLMNRATRRCDEWKSFSAAAPFDGTAIRSALGANRGALIQSQKHGEKKAISLQLLHCLLK